MQIIRVETDDIWETTRYWELQHARLLSSQAIGEQGSFELTFLLQEP